MTTFTRRSFLFQGAAAGFAFSVMPNLLVTRAEASPLAEAALIAVSWLGRNILTPVAVKLFEDWLTTTKVYPKKPDATFHGQFSPGFAFDRPFNAARTRYVGYLGVHDFPNLSLESRLSRIGELNVFEIMELQNDANPNLWAGGILRRVPVNESERFIPTRFDVDRFSYDLESSGIDPNYVGLEYARKFCDCSTGIPMRGYGWSSANGAAGFRIVAV